MQSDVLFDTYVAPNWKKLTWGNVMWQKILCGNVIVFSIGIFQIKSKYRYQTKENRKLKSGKICPVFNNGSFVIYQLFLHCLHELNPNVNQRLTVNHYLKPILQFNSIYKRYTSYKKSYLWSLMSFYFRNICYWQSATAFAINVKITRLLEIIFLQLRLYGVSVRFYLPVRNEKWISSVGVLFAT